MRPQIDLRVRGIPRRQFDDLDLAVQVEGDEMARMGGTIALAYHRIHLRGAWVAVVQAIKARSNPANKKLTEPDDHHGQDHPDPDAHQWHAAVSARAQSCRRLPGGDLRRGRLRRRLWGLGTRGSPDAWRLLWQHIRPDGTMTQGTPGSQAIR